MRGVRNPREELEQTDRSRQIHAHTQASPKPEEQESRPRPQHRHGHGRRAAVATIPSRISPEVGSQGTRNVARTFALPSVRASAQPRKAVAPSFVVSDLAAVQRDFPGWRIGFSGGANATVRIRVHRWVRAGSPGFLPQATTLEARNAT